jgi:cysteine synthase
MRTTWNGPPELYNPPVRIGNTPTRHIGLCLNGIEHQIILKEERWNTFGSLKDRVAWGLLCHAVTLGELKSGDSVIDASSGNLGCALAGLGRILNFKVTVVASPNVSTGNAEAIQNAGARLVIAESRSGETAHQARTRIVKEMVLDGAGHFLNQYANPVNYLTHKAWTAPEALEDCAIDACFLAASSGGTARGFAEYISENEKSMKLIVVDPHPSKVFEDPSKPDPQPFLTIPGFGAGKRSEFAPLPGSVQLVRVMDAQAVATFRIFRRFSLSSIGLSSAGIVVGVLHWLADQQLPKKVMCICPDGAEKYLGDIEMNAVLESKYPSLLNYESELETILGAAKVRTGTEAAVSK